MQNNLQDAQNERLLRETIQPLQKRVFRFPLYFLRTWVFSLLALIALPVGVMLMVVGSDLEANLVRDWEQTEATVDDRDEDGITFEIDDFNIDGEFSYAPMDYITYPQPGSISATLGVCDVVAWAWLSLDMNSETFPIWVNPDKINQYSCAPISRDAAAGYLVLGGLLSILSVIRLLRTFNQAATRRMMG